MNNIDNFLNKDYTTMELFNKEILITGGTGSLGKTITKILCEKYRPKGIRILSRDELKQKNMEKEFSEYKTNIAYLLGDVRDVERLKLAFARVEIVFHCAAMKHVDKCQNDPIEAKKTNIDGTQNVISACIYNGIKTAMFISTDKAVYPVNLYGATKMVAENIWIHSNTYSPHKTKFSACRYGNVLGSRGSVVEIFNQQKESGTLTITDRDMTRFWITLPEVAQFVLNCSVNTKGGDIFVPQMKSMKVINLAKEIAPCCKLKEIGIKDGEKLHECLVTEEESHYTSIETNRFTINRNHHYDIPFTVHSNDKKILMSKSELKEKLRSLYV